MAHTALYGNTKLLREKCYACGRMTFVIDGERQCCGRQSRKEARYSIRIANPTGKRKKPNKGVQHGILASQSNRCLYCQREFGSWVIYHGIPEKIMPYWDHIDPFVHNCNNHADNFAATCRFCNAWKHDRIFNNIAEIRDYVRTKWEKKEREVR
jgi:hypothetical protein